MNKDNELHQADIRSLRRFGADHQDPELVAEVLEYQKLWKGAQHVGGLPNTLMLMLAKKHSNKETPEVVVESEPEKAPVKKATAKKATAKKATAK